MRDCFNLVAAVFTVTLGIHSALAADANRLNVVFILVDDLGWSDVGCYGSDFYETPNIDRLAGQSVKFTSAYAAAPVCSPTRAAIMTGKVPARLDMTIWHEGAVGGGPTNRPLRNAVSEPNLAREETTLAELFRAAGYFTAHIGKWHLGTAAYYPETQGFDFSLGGTFWGAPATFFHPFTGRWNKNDSEIRYVPGLSPGAEGDYLPDRLTDEAIKLLTAVGNRAFFLNLCYYTVHSPIEAPADLIEKYRNKKPVGVHKEPKYAAMVERMDHNVGRVLDWLDQQDLLDETIVIFTSDNGGVDFPQRGVIPTSNAPLRSGKGTLYEGGVRVPLLVHWPGITRPGECREIVSSQDFFPTFHEYLGENFKLPDPRGEIDGVSLMPLLSGESDLLDRDTLCWHFPHYYPRMTPGSSIRRGDWKLVHYYEDHRAELYDLATDPGEQNNVAKKFPGVTSDLRKSLDEWHKRVGANHPTRQSASEE